MNHEETDDLEEMQSDPEQRIDIRKLEQTVLGSMMIDADIIVEIVTILGRTGESFVTVDHNLIYNAILYCSEEHQIAEPTMVATHLQNSNNLNRAGGALYLYDLQAVIVETVSALEYAKLLQTSWMRRQLRATALAMAEHAIDPLKGVAAVAESAYTAITNITMAQSVSKTKPVSQLVKQTIKTIEESYNNPDGIIGLSTGFNALDNITAGMHPGDLIIIAARPGVGKSTFIQNLAQNIAKQKLPVVMFSIEMPAVQVIMRMIAAESGVSLGRLRTGQLNEEHWDRLVAASTYIHSSPIYINDAQHLSVHDLAFECKKLQRQHPEIAAVIIDYLQLISGSTSTKRFGRVQEIGEISRHLKATAVEMQIPIIACSQLSREIEKRPEKRPLLSDLRDSGTLEQDADMVAFLYRDSYYDENADAGVEVDPSELIIKKQRNGPIGTINFQFHKKLMRFEESAA